MDVNYTFNIPEIVARIAGFLPTTDFPNMFVVNKCFSTAGLLPYLESTICDFFHEKYKGKIAKIQRIELFISKLQGREPQHGLIPLALGEIERIRQRLFQAAEHFKNIEGKGLSSDHTYLGKARLGFYYEYNKLPKEAITILEDSHNMFPADPLAMSSLGIFLLKSNPNEAKKLLDTAYSQDPDDFLITANSVRAFENSLEGFLQAKGRLEKYLSEFPECGSIAYLLAEIERSGVKNHIEPNLDQAYRYYTLSLSNQGLLKEEWYALALVKRATLCLGKNCPKELYNPMQVQKDLEWVLKNFSHNYRVMSECAPAFTVVKEHFQPAYNKAAHCLEAVVNSQAEKSIKAEACYNLGLLYGSGGFGLEKNIAKSHWWHEKALAFAPQHLGAAKVLNTLPQKPLLVKIEKKPWLDYPEGAGDLVQKLIGYLQLPYSKKVEASAHIGELVETLSCIDPEHNLVSLCLGEQCLMRQDTQGAASHFEKLKAYADYYIVGELHPKETMLDLCALVLSRVGICEFYRGYLEQAAMYLERARKMSKHQDVLTLVYSYRSTSSEKRAEEILALGMDIDDPEAIACSIMIRVSSLELSGNQQAFSLWEPQLINLQQKFPANILINLCLAELYRDDNALRKDFAQSYHYYSLAVQDTTLIENSYYCLSLARRATLVLRQENETDPQREQAAKDLRIARRSQSCLVEDECQKGEKLLYKKRATRVAFLYGIPLAQKSVPQTNGASHFPSNSSVQEGSSKLTAVEAREIASALINEGKFTDAKPYLQIAYHANRLDPSICVDFLKVLLYEKEQGIATPEAMQETMAVAWELFDQTQNPELKELIDRAMV
jgi:TPR repeat protein